MNYPALCTKAPIGYERYQGQCGTLNGPTLPNLHCTFVADEGGNFVLDEPNQWCFVPVPARVCTCATRLAWAQTSEPHEPYCAMKLDTDPSYRVVAGATAQATGVPDPPSDVAAEPEPAQYNAADFERDLDEAIAEAKALVRIPVDGRLSFRSGELDRAITEVVTTLMWRVMSERAKAEVADVVWRTTRNLLIQKNAAYGDSALNPVRVFSRASPMEQLLVRLDDKVSRLQRGHAAGEDVAADMLGYLLLILIARKREARSVDAKVLPAHWVARK